MEDNTIVEKEVHERSMETHMTFFEAHRSLILALIFAVPVISIFLYPLIFLGSGNKYFIDTFAFVFLFAALALTLNLEIGYLGLPNFGKVAFVMIGAYSYGMSGEYHLNFLGMGEVITGLIVATVVTGFAGVILTLPTLRLREDYFAIVTIVAGEILRLVANNEETLGGFSGFSVTNFVYREFNPDTTMSGSSLYGPDILIVLLLVIVAVMVYILSKKQFKQIFDEVKATKYGLQRSLTWTGFGAMILIFLNFKTAFHSNSSLALDIFLILIPVITYMLKFAVEFLEGMNLDMVIYGVYGGFVVISLLSYFAGGINTPGSTNINNVNWYFMILTAAVMMITFFVLELVYHSPFGRALRAVREDDTSATSIGKSLFGLRLRGLIVSNALTGFVAAFYAMLLTNISPQAFLPLLTFQLYIMIIIGGTGNNKGVIFGAIVVQLLTQGTRQLNRLKIYYPFFTQKDYLHWGRVVSPFNLALIIVGVTLIIFLIYAPEGIFPEKRNNNEAYLDLLYMTEYDETELHSNPVLSVLSKITRTPPNEIYLKEEF